MDTPPSAGYLARGARATVRRVPFPAIRLMLWLAGRGDQPTESPNGSTVLIAPAVPGWIREANPGEAALWHWLAMDRPRHLFGYSQTEPIRTLSQAGALRHAV